PVMGPNPCRAEQKGLRFIDHFSYEDLITGDVFRFCYGYHLARSYLNFIAVPLHFPADRQAFREFTYLPQMSVITFAREDFVSVACGGDLNLAKFAVPDRVLRIVAQAVLM